MQEQLMIPGPMHPDLFGGETPIMVPVPGQVYEFTVKWQEFELSDHEKTGYIHAMNEVAAEDRLKNLVENDWNVDEVYDTTGIEINLLQLTRGTVTRYIYDKAINAIPDTKEAA